MPDTLDRSRRMSIGVTRQQPPTSRAPGVDPGSDFRRIEAPVARPAPPARVPRLTAVGVDDGGLATCRTRHLDQFGRVGRIDAINADRDHGGAAPGHGERFTRRLTCSRPSADAAHRQPRRHAARGHFRQQGFRLGQVGNRLDGQDVRTGRGQLLDSRPVESPQLGNRHSVVTAVLGAVGKGRSVRADGGGHPTIRDPVRRCASEFDAAAQHGLTVDAEGREPGQ